jgi:hypothetical protein
MENTIGEDIQQMQLKLKLFQMIFNKRHEERSCILSMLSFVRNR